MFDLAVFSQDALQMQPQGEFVLPAGIKPETFHLPSVTPLEALDQVKISNMNIFIGWYKNQFWSLWLI